MPSAIRFVRWRDESGTIRAGLSEHAQVMPLATVMDGVETIEGLWRYCRDHQLDLTAFSRESLKRHGERITVPPERYVIPVDLSELWAAGVTYDQSRDAREAETTSDRTIYTKVYEAQRPELFFKAVGPRVRGPNQPVGVRRDAHWHVPEPELTAILDQPHSIIGYTVGNDMTARDLEAENPLYLPQAKMFDGGAAIGPAMVLAGSIDPLNLSIRLEIRRRGRVLYAAEESTRRLRRSPMELMEQLQYAYSVAPWTGLMTGTGIVPPDDLALTAGDEVLMTIEEIGTLRNPVAWVPA